MSEEQENIQKMMRNAHMDAAAEKVMDMLPEMTKKWSVEAKVLKIKYDALIKVGFSDEEALSLCTRL